MNISIAEEAKGKIPESGAAKEYTLPWAYLSIVRQCNTFFSIPRFKWIMGKKGQQRLPFAIRQLRSTPAKPISIPFASHSNPSWKLWLRHFHQLIAIMLLRWKALGHCCFCCCRCVAGILRHLQQHTNKQSAMLLLFCCWVENEFTLK